MEKFETNLNLIQRALQFDELENFVDGLKLMHLTELVRSGGPFTVFAPLNIAFLKIPEKVSQAIEDHNNLLSTILQYHIVPGRYDSTELVAVKQLTTLIGESVYPMQGKGKLWINEVELLHSDIVATNGIIHIVDRLLVPNMNDWMPCKVAGKEEHFNLLQAS